MDGIHANVAQCSQALFNGRVLNRAFNQQFDSFESAFPPFKAFAFSGSTSDPLLDVDLTVSGPFEDPSLSVRTPSGRLELWAHPPRKGAWRSELRFIRNEINTINDQLLNASNEIRKQTIEKLQDDLSKVYNEQELLLYSRMMALLNSSQSLGLSFDEPHFQWFCQERLRCLNNRIRLMNAANGRRAYQTAIGGSPPLDPTLPNSYQAATVQVGVRDNQNETVKRWSATDGMTGPYHHRNDVHHPFVTTQVALFRLSVSERNNVNYMARYHRVMADQWLDQTNLPNMYRSYT